MQFAKFLVPCVVGLTWTAIASAQVYESRDAQGNTVFSDKPSAGAEVIKVPATNTADPVAEVPDRPQAAPKAAAPQRGSANAGSGGGARGEDDDDYIYYGGGSVDQDKAQERLEEQERHREEGAGKPGREPPVQVEPHRSTPRPAAGGGRR